MSTITKTSEHLLYLMACALQGVSAREEILADVKRIFIDEELNNNYEEKRLHIYNYAKPKPHVNHYNFLKYCQKFRDMD